MTLLELIDEVDTAKRSNQATMREVLAWLEANPHAWQYMEQYALQAAQHGHRFGINALIERVRWEVKYVEGRPYKVNNSFGPAIARLLVKKHPQLQRFIQMRASHFDKEVIFQ